MLEGVFCIGEGSGDNKVPHRSRVVPVGGGGGGVFPGEPLGILGA